jgi:hypothetical protein
MLVDMVKFRIRCSVDRCRCRGWFRRRHRYSGCKGIFRVRISVWISVRASVLFSDRIRYRAKSRLSIKVRVWGICKGRFLVVGVGLGLFLVFRLGLWLGLNLLLGLS